MELIFQMEKCMGTTEETSQGKQWRKPNLFLEIPTRPLEVSPQELVQINMPPTPKRVNFFLTPSPSASLLNESSGPSSTRGISSIRNILPKLSFKTWGYNSDVDKFANLDPSSSNVATQDKLSITRSWSFSKIFTPRIKRTSSLPLTEIANSNSGSAHGGSVNSYLTVDVSSWKLCSA